MNNYKWMTGLLMGTQLLTTATLYAQETAETEVAVKRNIVQKIFDREARKSEASLGTKIARGAGKGSVWVTRNLFRPSIFAAGFVRGLVTKEEKQRATLALIDIVMTEENLKKMDELTKNSGSFDSYIENMQDFLTGVLEAEQERVMVSVLRDLDPENVKEDSQLEDIDFLMLDYTKLTPELLQNNEAYLRAEALIGEQDEAALIDAIQNGKPTGLDELDEEQIMNRIPIASMDWKQHAPEVTGALLLKSFVVPQLLKGFFGKAVMQSYNWVTLPATAGAGISVWQCMREENQERIDNYHPSIMTPNDAHLQKFCREALNKTVYRVLRSRIHGLKSGAQFKTWLKKTFKKRSKDVDSNNAK